MSPKDKELQKLKERDYISKHFMCVSVFTLCILNGHFHN
jgi:hypothetical protein